MSAPVPAGLERLRVGISTCPNDTFAFHGLLTGAVRAPGLQLDFELCDVQELNEGLRAGRFDVAKVSFHAALCDAHTLTVLPSGAALGFGNGPLLLAARPDTRPGPTSRVLCPGADTTATLLYRLFHAGAAAPTQALFSDIMPALERGAADFGVCIHEGRFTYAARGLHLVEDLGEVWERDTSEPLPLGGIVARRALGDDVARRMQAGLLASLAYARAEPTRALPTMRRYAAELDDDVLWRHVELYVNAWTDTLGPGGRRALATFSERAARALDLPSGARGLAVLGPPLDAEGAPRRLFHLVERGAHDAHDLRQPWAPASLAREGFVHLSFAAQVAGTLALHFAGAREVTLLELDPLRVSDALVVEASRGGDAFPHLYRALVAEDVLARTPLARGASGPFELPAL